MPLYVGDYLRDTRDLSTLQHGAYLLLIMHYWQHDALPTDDRQLAAIAGLSLSAWRRIGAPIKAKFRDGWRHKRIEAELVKAERVAIARRRAGTKGGLRSGVARAIAHGEAIIAVQAQAKQMLRLRGSGDEANAPAKTRQTATNHNHRIISSLLSDSPTNAEPTFGQDGASEPAEVAKPPCQLSRQELDALFARRNAAAASNAAAAAAPSPAVAPNEPNGD
jgi:uncharacterized protein YdaU (DUF1376 family)